MKYFRSIYCGDLNLNYLNKIINLFGWIHKVRNYGKIIFIDLKDRTGIIQVVILNKISNIIFNKFLKQESCVMIQGILSLKIEKSVNFFLNTGNIELVCLNLIFINISKIFLFSANSLSLSKLDSVKNRLLYLRRKFMQNNLLMRFKIISYIRNILNKEKFIDIETPFLSKSTPEGSRDFLIPYRFIIGYFFALPQSPQIFKQLLMISSFDRYYQIVKCFRDEDLRSNRQPEFTQLDCELSFNNEINIKFLFENIFIFIILKIFTLKIKKFFFIINYSNCLNKFFSDKPDLRLKSKVFNISFFLKFKFFYKKYKFRNFRLILIKISNGFKLFGKNFKNYKFFLKNYIYNKIFILISFKKKNYYNIYVYNDIKKFSFNKIFIFEIISYFKLLYFDLYFIILEKYIYLRNFINFFLKNIHFSNYSKKNNLINFSFIPIWVINFPIFKYNYILKKIDFTHNPFSSPIALDILYLDFNPLKSNSRSYDLILNGDEIAGGSIRNYKLYIQKKIFFIVNLNNVEYNFNFFLNSLKYGTPFHGGIAFGIDRLISVLIGINSIRDVIAFPKTQSINCLITESPVNLL